VILLRDYQKSDAPLLVEYLNNPKVTRYLTSSIPQPFTEKAAGWWIKDGTLNKYIRAIEYNGVFVGTIGAVREEFERSKSAEVGYWLATPYWGKGIATKALSTFTDNLFESTDLVRLFSQVFEGNKGSLKVLEKNGYELEGRLKKAVYKDDKIFDAFLYAKVRK
jgi:ribosomal-protein-alanine N-acetyltransferase